MNSNNHRSNKKGRRRYSRKKISILALVVAFIAFSGMRCIRQCEGGNSDGEGDSLSVACLPFPSINKSYASLTRFQRLSRSIA